MSNRIICLTEDLFVVNSLKRRRSLVKILGVVNDVSKTVTECLRAKKIRYMPMHKTLEQSDIRIKSKNKINQVFFIFHTREFSVNRKDLPASTLVGLTR